MYLLKFINKIKFQTIGYITIGLLILSCNKNTLELPPLENPPTINIACNYENKTVLEASLNKDLNDPDNQVTISLKNISGKDIINTTLNVSFNTKYPNNYDTPERNIILFIDTLESNQKDNFLLPFDIDAWNKENINISLLKVNGSGHILSGLYSSIYAKFEKPNKELNYLGFVRGAVQADGLFSFQIKAPDSAYYYINGNFVDTLGLIDATLLNSKGTLVSPLALDSLNNKNSHFINDSNIMSFRVRLLKELSDSTQSILINLKKENL